MLYSVVCCQLGWPKWFIGIGTRSCPLGAHLFLLRWKTIFQWMFRMKHLWWNFSARKIRSNETKECSQCSLTFIRQKLWKIFKQHKFFSGHKSFFFVGTFYSLDYYYLSCKIVSKQLLIHSVDETKQFFMKCIFCLQFITVVFFAWNTRKKKKENNKRFPFLYGFFFSSFVCLWDAKCKKFFHVLFLHCFILWFKNIVFGLSKTDMYVFLKLPF